MIEDMILAGDYYLYDPEYVLEQCRDLLALCELLIDGKPPVIGIYGSIPFVYLDPNEDGQGCSRQIFQYNRYGAFRTEHYYVADFDTSSLGIPCKYKGMGEYRLGI